MPCGVVDVLDATPSVSDQYYPCSGWSVPTSEETEFEPQGFVVDDFDSRDESSDVATGGCVSLGSSTEAPERRGVSAKGKSMSDPSSPVSRDGFFCSDYYSYSLRRSTKRLTMLGTPKFRQKEERKKVLKISQNKLKRIDDPESCLYRSVLINNTVKRLQNEAKEEKLNKQKNSGKSCRSYSSQNLAFEDKYDSASPQTSGNCAESDQATNTSLAAKRKLDDSDLSHILSQVYMPPTPRMITSIDSDDEDLETQYCKRPKIESESDNSVGQTMTYSDDCSEKAKTVPERDSGLGVDKQHEVNSISVSDAHCKTNDSQYARETSDSQSVQFALRQLEDMYYMPERKNVLGETEKQYSCGQASMFGELQTVVFHSLITSLES